jgi:hypothetical protein
MIHEEAQPSAQRSRPPAKPTLQMIRRHGSSPRPLQALLQELALLRRRYNSGGREVARQKLGSPTLELMSGWHEFTPKYIRWKTHQRP